MVLTCSLRQSLGSLLTAGLLMPRELLLSLALRSGETASVELYWRLIGKLENGQTGSLSTLLLDRPKGNFLTTELLR